MAHVFNARLNVLSAIINIWLNDRLYDVLNNNKNIYFKTLTTNKKRLTKKINNNNSNNNDDRRAANQHSRHTNDNHNKLPYRTISALCVARLSHPQHTSDEKSHCAYCTEKEEEIKKKVSSGFFCESFFFCLLQHALELYYAYTHSHKYTITW